MMTTSGIFTDAVTLEKAEPEHFDLAFTAVTQPCPWPKAYGGDLVAAAAAAAMRSVTDGKTLHSMHSYFLRPADIGAQVRYEVELLRDGRGYSTRQVRGYQNGKPLYAAFANFAAGEPGGSYRAELAGLVNPEELPSSAGFRAGRAGDGYRAEMAGLTNEGELPSSAGFRAGRAGDGYRAEMAGLTNEEELPSSLEFLADGAGDGYRSKTAGLANPEELPSSAKILAGRRSKTAGLADPEELPSSAQFLADRAGGTMTDESKAYWAGGRSFDMRHVPGPVYLTVEGAKVPHQAVWVKPFDPLRPVDGLTDAQRDLAALAYVCDYTILEPVLRVLDLPWARPGLVTASLDHAMWFHREGPVDDWLLYAQEAVAADSGRGLGYGRFFTRDGLHLATVAQEGMIRAS
ncbi:acyl-CoA thioesterase [Lentzea albida]|uniref:Thioesterase-like superfamily protein n=1 Tax=Lentzea albida TaxID=65499 RepID=A0A1H9S627_9PSEU|nr:acyl-CoA thioesterase domain-containing protein [Lentzea albida]SER80421.1 Thioesterase-like superfamily protein [Lentzea albida]